jgi:hypothetical protein
MRFSDFLLVSNPTDLNFIVGYTDDQNIRINVLDLFAGQIIGSGTAGYVPLFTAANVIDDSVIFQHGSNIVIGGVNSLGYKLAVSGSLYSSNGAVINSTVSGADALRVIGGDGDIFVIPNDLGQSISSLRRIIHPPAVLTTESATLGQVNTAISNLDAEIDILLNLKVDKTSVGQPNGVASLDSGGKVPLSQIPDSIIGQVQYMGTWNAFTNTPTLNPLIPEERGHYYVVSAAGVFGGVDYAVGDWIISNGVIWEKVDNTDAVTSVFGRIGAILPLEADYQSFYPRLSQAYDNPTWINTLAFTKITGVPAFLLENQTITLSGDVTGSGKTSISSTISNNAVSNEKLRDSVGTSVIGRAANSTGDPADIQASTDGHVLLRSAGNLLFGLISSDSISSINWSKITGTPTTLSGYGITDAYTKTESDNKFIPYTGANTNVNLGSNNITANSFIKAGGTSSQFLKADGSVDTSQYVPTTRSVNAGTGLTGGGNLSSDVTISFDTTWGDTRYAYRTRQLTINGTTFDLSADRTWSVGTVNTLTTIGTTGPATLVGNTLNIPQYTDQFVGTVTSVGLSMPPAFTVSNSPVTSAGTLTVVGAGNATQYVRGDGALATLPTSGTGGGASVSYYLNGSVNQGTIGGVTYYEMNRTPIIGAGTDFTRNTNGYIASFLTDAGDPALLAIPAGNWNFETYFNASSGGGSPTFYIELYKYNGTTFTLIASNSGSPKLINDGTSIEAYFSALAVPQTTLTLTDRLAIRIYVNTSGRTITLHTENGHLCQVITTFTTGLSALNGLTSQVQFFAVGTSGTNFNIASATDTHTFNLPTASATNRGALSSTDWTTFNNKQNQLNGTGFVKASGTTITYDNSTYQVTSEKGQPNGYASLDGNGKVPLAQINDALIGNVNYQGLWNAATNNPTLVNPPSSGTKGYYYIVSTAGTFAGISFEVGDWIISNGSAWQKVDNTDAVSSVFGRTGNVIAANGDYNTSLVTENTNLYYTEARVNANANVAANTAARHNAVTLGTANGLSLNVQQLSLQLATSGQNGALSSTDWSTFNNKENAITAGTTAQYFRGDKTFQTLNTSVVPELTNLYYTEARVSANTDVAANTAARHASVTLGIQNGLGLTGQQLSLGLASAGVTGALSGTDWSTFNSKQQALNGTGFVKISGTTISYDNSTYLTTAAAASTYLPLAGGTMTGQIVLTTGTGGGIRFPNDPFGGGSDTAGMRLISRGGEAMSLEIYTTNDADDWVNISVPSNDSAKVNGNTIWNAGNITPVPTSRTITINGTTQDLSDNRTYNVGTVTSVTASSPLFSSGGATPNITIQQASGSTNGFLSSTDWTTFNNKQAALNGTGFVKISGTTISYDNSTYYLASNPSAFITLTSLSNVAPIQYNNTTGAISITQASGSTNGFLSSTDWNTFNNKTSNVGTVTSVAALTLGTSGTDLSSTVANGTTTPVITLNVPTASAANRGALSAADWTTFNNKQNALTNPVTGTGDANYLPKFTGASTIGNSQIFDNAGNILIGAESNAEGAKLKIAGGYVFLKETGGADVYFRSAFNTNQAAIQVASSNDLAFATSNVSRMVLTLSGNLTIGNNSVSAINERLNVTGNGILIESTDAGSSMLFGHFGGTDGIIGTFTNQNLQIRTNNSTRATLDTSGNLGLGVTPSAWNSGYKALQFGNGSVMSRATGSDLYILGNSFFDAGGWKYYNSSFPAQMYASGSGEHAWYNAPVNSGSAGAAISWTQAMTLGSNSGLSIGTPSAAPAQGLLVQGEGRFSSRVNSQTLYVNSTEYTFANFVTSVIGPRPAADGIANLWLRPSDASNNVGFNLAATSSTFSIGSLVAGPFLSMAISTGAATFSSSVTTGGGIQTNISKSGSGIENVNFLQLRLFGTNAIGDSLDIRYLNSAGNNIANISAILGGDNVAYGSLAFSTRNYFTDSMVEVMRINNRGNVGIGTASPQMRLHIVNTSNTLLQLNGNNTTAALDTGFTISADDSKNIYLYQRENAATIFGTNNTERMRITSGGNTELYGNLSLRASATGSTATHVPVFIADPASTTRSLLTRTLQDFKFDVGSFIAKGVRSNAGDYTRTLDSVNDYSLWQDNFDWDASYNRSKVIIEAQTTGNINSSNTADKQLTIGWGISSDTNFNGDDYCTVNVPLGTGAVDYNVIINGTITITSNSELKMVIRVQIASGNVIEQNVMRMANVTAAGAMLNAAKNIAFTGKMNVTGTHTWSQRQTYLTIN